MLDPQQVLLSNLTEALRQVQRYVVVGLWTGISALALTPGSGMLAGEPASATPPGSPIAFDPETARVLLLGICTIAGALASYAAENANRAARKLSGPAALMEAVRLFPGFPTSPYAPVRYGAAALPAIFALAAVVLHAFHSSNMDHFGVWIACVIVAAPYLALVTELKDPVGVVEPAPPDGEGEESRADSQGSASGAEP
jgi:hypothetical protein